MGLTAGKKNKTVANFFSLSLLQVGNYVLPMVTLPIISRVIGPENYGVINYAFAYVGYFILLINAGFDLYGSRLIVAHKNETAEISKIFNRIITSKLLLLAIAAVLFAGSIHFIPQLQTEKLVGWFTFIMCIGWVINPSWLYHGMQESRKYAIFSFLSKLAFSIVVIIVVRQRDDYLYHPLITSLAHVLVSAFSFYYALRHYKLTFKQSSWPEVITTLKENRKLSLIWWISNAAVSTNIVIAGFFISTLQIGYFSAALRLIVIIQSIITMPLNTVLFPYIGEAFVQGNENGMARVSKAFPYLVLTGVVIALGTYIFSDYVIHGFYGKEFSNAIPILKIFSLVLFLSTINSALGQQVLLHLKQDSVYMRMVLLGFGLNMFFLLLFIIYGGTVAAAWAWPLSELLVFAMYFIYFQQNHIRVHRWAYYNPIFLVTQFLQILKLRSSK